MPRGPSSSTSAMKRKSSSSLGASKKFQGALLANGHRAHGKLELSTSKERAQAILEWWSSSWALKPRVKRVLPSNTTPVDMGNWSVPVLCLSAFIESHIGETHTGNESLKCVPKQCHIKISLGYLTGNTLKHGWTEMTTKKDLGVSQNCGTQKWLDSFGLSLKPPQSGTLNKRHLHCPSR